MASSLMGSHVEASGKCLAVLQLAFEAAEGPDPENRTGAWRMQMGWEHAQLRCGRKDPGGKSGQEVCVIFSDDVTHLSLLFFSPFFPPLLPSVSSGL